MTAGAQLRPAPQTVAARRATAEPAPRPRPVADPAPLRRPGLAIPVVAVASAVIVGAGAALGPAPGVAALAAVAGGLALLRRPAAAALVLVGIAPAASGLARGMPLPGLRFSEAVIAAVAVLVLATADRSRQLPWRMVDWLLLGYAAATALLGSYDLLERGAAFDGDALGTLAGPLQFLLLYRAALAALRTATDRRRAIAVVLLASVPVSLVAIAQGIGVPGIWSFTVTATGNPITDDFAFQQLPRAVGLFPHWQILGGYLLVVILLAVAVLSDRSPRRALPVPVLAAVIGLATASLVLTLTFANLAVAVLGSLVIAFWAGRGGKVLAWGGVGGAAVAAVFGTLIADRFQLQTAATATSDRPWFVPQTLAYRWDVWTDQYFPVLSGHWLTGYGPGTPPGVTFGYTESVYLELLLRGGVVLLAIYLGLVIALFAAAWPVARGVDVSAETRIASRVLVVLLAALVYLHLLEPYFVVTGLPHVLWVLAALAFGEGTRRAR